MLVALLVAYEGSPPHALVEEDLVVKALMAHTFRSPLGIAMNIALAGDLPIRLLQSG